MEVLVAFAAALLAFRLAGLLAGRYRSSGRPELLPWAAGLGAYAVAAAAIAWGEAAGWDDRAFRVYYAAGGLLTAPLLGAGSLLLAGRRRAAPVVLVYVGFAVGVALVVPVHGAFAAHGIPAAQDHLDFVPARLLAIVANVVGTLAVVVVALRSIRRRPLGNGLIVAGIVAAALGSGLAGLGAAGSAIGIAVGAVLLYAGFVAPAHIPRSFWPKLAHR
jgi:stage V sporulation protein SpoVS